MKKNIRLLTFFLATIMLVACLQQPVFAEQLEETVETEEETLPVASEDAPETDYAFGSTCILNGCRTLDGQVPLGGSARRLETAQGVVVYERTTGTLVYAYNPDAKLAPGSLSKIVTALIVLERVPDLDAVVTVRAGIAGRIPGGAQAIGLKSEEELTVRDLLHCMILQNAADAAVALAEYVAGNQTSFVELMNARLQQIGCTNTSLGNVHGFDNVNQYTTARDLARFMMVASENDAFVELLSTQSYTVPKTNMVDERSFKSLNYLMETSIVPKYNDSRVTSGFSSYAPTSGAGLVCTATNTNEKKRGLDVVCVILGATRYVAENGWTVTYYGNFDEMVELLKYTFDNYKVNRVLYDGMSWDQFPVSDGECQVVGGIQVDVDSVLPDKAHMKNIIRRSTVTGGGLSAPIKKGDLIGTTQLWYRDSCLMEAELFAMEDVRTNTDSGVSIENGLTKKDTEKGLSRIVLIGSSVILIPVVSYLVINSLLRARRNAMRKRGKKKRRSY